MTTGLDLETPFALEIAAEIEIDAPVDVVWRSRT
jgi:hypothetical protein